VPLYGVDFSSKVHAELQKGETTDYTDSTDPRCRLRPIGAIRVIRGVLSGKPEIEAGKNLKRKKLGNGHLLC
jgi:hypothetical protein